MSDINHYKPGVEKLIFHPEHLAKIKSGEICGPIHVSYFPNNRCNLNCEYCCFGNTERDDAELSFRDFFDSIDVLIKYGLKAVEISGGGEPLLWTHFSKAVEYAYSKGLQLSLVTNGLLLETISQDALSKFTWIRVSIQSTKYAEKIAWDYIPKNVKRSASFIVYNDRTVNELPKLYSWAKESNTIIRVAPNRPCDKSWEDVICDEVGKYGYPLLFFRKSYEKIFGCYFAWVRAAIMWTGEFVVCPSPELSEESKGQILDKYRLCKIDKLEDWILNNPPHDLGYRCDFCNCSAGSNLYLYNLLNNKIEDVNFV